MRFSPWSYYVLAAEAQREARRACCVLLPSRREGSRQPCNHRVPASLSLSDVLPLCMSEDMKIFERQARKGLVVVAAT
jgi:hypothetical protein